MGNRLDQTAFIRAVGRVTQHAAGLHRVVTVGSLEGRYACLMTRVAEGVAFVDEKGLLVRGVSIVARLAPLYQGRMDIGPGKRLAIVAGKAGFLSLCLQE